MEEIYAIGVVCIEYIQEWFSDSEWYFEQVNKVFNPNNITEVWLPLICIADAVFGVQLLFCMSFGGWLNAILKWFLDEDRPYWWVRETTYYRYTGTHPILHQTTQSCETGPGSPSGHCTAAAGTIVLVLMWIKHIMHDRRYYIEQWKTVMYPLSVFAILSVMVARMYVATHFPHQVLFGTLIGVFLAPFLCLYITDPFIWRYGRYSCYPKYNIEKRHVAGAMCVMIVSGLVYSAILLLGRDPQRTVKLAFRWCEYPDSIHVSTTPIYAVVINAGILLGIALSLTPAVADYRHNTTKRSLLIAALCTLSIVYGSQYILDNICKSKTLLFYATHFSVSAFKPFLFFKTVPALATCLYKTPEKPNNKRL